MELHTFRTDYENRTKESKGVFKLNNKSIAIAREDLATDYQDLAYRHSEEVAQILEEYSATELEIAHQLQANEADRLATGQQTRETLELLESPPEDAGPTPQEKAVAATLAPPVSEPTVTEAADSRSTPIIVATKAATPSPTTSYTSLQAEPCTTREQPTHPEPPSEQATARADLTPLQTNETMGAVETEATAAEPPRVTTPPTDPTPPEPSILDIFDDA